VRTAMPRFLTSMVLTPLAGMLLTGSVNFADGYPMIMEIAESSERCLRLNIPEDDDAHMVFLSIPSPTFEQEEAETPPWITKYSGMETYFFGQMLEITTKKRKKIALPRKFPGSPSEEIKAAMDSFIEYFEGEEKAGLQVKLSNPKSSSTRTMETFWFTPIVINHLRKAVRANADERESSPLEGYSACFVNTNPDFPVRMVVDSVMTSEEFGVGDDDNVSSEDASFDGAHLTPLAEQLAESLSAAQSVIREMNYMERRESRMRLTADSINARVRYFSYISVGVLLVVTYVQVTYLKRYFRKKKLL